MQCPKCGTKLLPTFKWCPECGIPLQRAQIIPCNVEHGDHGVEITVLQQNVALTRENGDLGLDNSSIQGKLNIDLIGVYHSWLIC